MAPLARPAAMTFTDTPSGEPEKQSAVMESLMATLPIGTALMECSRNMLPPSAASKLPALALVTIAMSPRVSLTDTRFTGIVMLLPEMQHMYDKLQHTSHYISYFYYQ
jgi:hypothetical protein